MSKTHEAEIICTNIIGAFPDKSLDDFLDMVSTQDSWQTFL